MFPCTVPLLGSSESSWHSSGQALFDEHSLYPDWVRLCLLSMSHIQILSILPMDRNKAIKLKLTTLNINHTSRYLSLCLPVCPCALCPDLVPPLRGSKEWPSLQDSNINLDSQFKEVLNLKTQACEWKNTGNGLTGGLKGEYTITEHATGTEMTAGYCLELKEAFALTSLPSPSAITRPVCDLVVHVTLSIAAVGNASRKLWDWGHHT